ncbi:disease resistance protein RGA2-like [Camellia sinensis]|uniref:NB-ARC domain-containing protein n=1 Tax=Camellia sinensis var. sinensis TaxID=542762 RepID=A0A4S4ENZ2_CAMSN|nr:disease resistance protein RGA2-like [Camellia sinensis]THG17945.1 hypothetical protein TEA_016521 [Camellia sinensis var. sinensis]
MVETILFNLASKILGMIGSGPIGEVGKAWGVEQELNALKDTLSTINAVLLDAERLYGHGGFPNYSIAMGVWFDRLQAAIYDADNLVDEFHYEVLRSRVTRTFLVSNFFSSSCTIDFRFKFKMSSRIANIRKRLDMIADNRTKFHPIATTSQHNAASSSISSEVNESEFVGRFDDRVKLLHLIMAPRVNNDENMFVLPIVGIAGIGKTALVRLLYNHEMVAKHFQLRIWVKVEQYLNVKDVMQKIFQRITDSPHCAGLHSYQLKNLLQEKLHNTKFLLVLDNLCDCDNREWHKLYDLLRCGCIMGSKIIVTTRYIRVATIVGTVPTHNLDSLSDKDCLEVLWKWAGCREKLGEKHVNAKLSKIAKEIVKKCHGYPRAAKTLGNNLFMETDESKWLELKEKQLWELPQKKRDILAVLRSSYDTQSTELKRCFIYCSIFPKSYEIEIDKLIQLWMAQGLIQSSGLTGELEDTGTDYLNQLCSIFFLEKTEEQHGNLSNTCRMPEIIHDLAVYMANEECLITTNYRFGPISDKVKHVSFHDFDCSGEEVTKALFERKNLRTVFFPFQGLGASDTGFVNRCISKFKYLYVLDLSCSCFQVLPHSIGNLKHLRFFDISGNANIETLPNAICKLFNLQTLRIWYCVKIRKLPKNIGNLICLRHLYLTTQQSCLPERQIQRLTSLQSFRITGCGNLKSLPKGMRLLVKLKTVTIAACPKLTSLPSTMKNLPKLRNLEISNCPNLDLAGWEDVMGLRRLQ